ncbi:hypothetical protein BJV78DRAFT_1157242 [Lactifluus subvellereus]|nr:hypothetical protein BJV78DRAFT_1157242 [Lactifluus subvellereus]
MGASCNWCKLGRAEDDGTVPVPGRGLLPLPRGGPPLWAALSESNTDARAYCHVFLLHPPTTSESSLTYLTCPFGLPPFEGSADVHLQGEHTINSQHLLPIRVPPLNDDVLLNIFLIYRLHVCDEDEDDKGIITMHWGLERWWYKLAQVCRRWRYLILASQIRLNLHLVCTYGTPVADMLENSSSLPLIINFLQEGREMTAKDEQGVLLALQHRDRVRRVGFWIPASNLGKLIMAMDDEFPNLERLFIRCWDKDDSSLTLPKTFQAPHLRRLILLGTALPTVSPVLTSTADLVTLVLHDIPPSAYFDPGYLLTRLAIMLRLETLAVRFQTPLPNREVVRQLSRIPITTHVTLPSLRRFIFRGVNAYSEGLLARLTTPLLGILEIIFYNQLTYTVTNLFQYMRRSENLNFSALRLNLTTGGIVLTAKRRPGGGDCPFRMLIGNKHFDWQVASAVQIFDGFGPLLSTVEKLTLGYEVHDSSEEWHNAVDRTHWRELLRPFNNVKTLHVETELFGKISDSLQSDDGEPALDLLPNLKKLGYSGETKEAFAPFINERKERGCPQLSISYNSHHATWRNHGLRDRRGIWHGGSSTSAGITAVVLWWCSINQEIVAEIAQVEVPRPAGSSACITDDGGRFRFRDIRYFQSVQGMQGQPRRCAGQPHRTLRKRESGFFEKRRRKEDKMLLEHEMGIPTWRPGAVVYLRGVTLQGPRRDDIVSSMADSDARSYSNWLFCFSTSSIRPCWIPGDYDSTEVAAGLGRWRGRRRGARAQGQALARIRGQQMAQQNKQQKRVNHTEVQNVAPSLAGTVKAARRSDRSAGGGDLMSAGVVPGWRRNSPDDAKLAAEAA